MKNTKQKKGGFFEIGLALLCISLLVAYVLYKIPPEPVSLFHVFFVMLALIMLFILLFVIPFEDIDEEK